jgi:hypothetical protein
LEYEINTNSPPTLNLLAHIFVSSVQRSASLTLQPWKRRGLGRPWGAGTAGLGEHTAGELHGWEDATTMERGAGRGGAQGAQQNKNACHGQRLLVQARENDAWGRKEEAGVRSQEMSTKV